MEGLVGIWSDGFGEYFVVVFCYVYGGKFFGIGIGDNFGVFV